MELSGEIIWVMGQSYQRQQYNRGKKKFTKEEEQRKEFPNFFKDIESRIYFTYRSNFPPIANSIYTSDVGWGCMIRCSSFPSPPFIYYY